jgi:predicted nucleotidyltransferase
MAVVEPARVDLAEVVDSLRRAGARFAFLHGSQASGRARPDSDVDVAAWWGREERPAPWSIALPAGVDLLVLDDAPLELAGRVAVDGVLLFDDDPPARVEWQATTRLVYFDEEWRQRWVTRTFLEAHAHGR